jgi:enolase
MEAIEKAGHKGKIELGMDVAASEFLLKDGRYDLDFKTQNNDGKFVKTVDQMVALYKEFVKNYPMVSIEDPFDQDDFNGYKKLLPEVGKKCQIVGDDLLVTNPVRVKKAIQEKWCNALLLKVN